MGERITIRDCERLLGHIVENRLEELPDIDRLTVYRESGVYRLRLRAVAPGTWVSDISPGCLTAREMYLYLRGLSDGGYLVDEVRRHTESDLRELARREAS